MSYEPYLYYTRQVYNDEYNRAYWDNLPEGRETREAYVKRNSALATVQLNEIYEAGFEIDQLAEWQYRIDGMIDIYPRNHRWHDIKTGKRGDYRPGELLNFLQKRYNHG